MRGVPAIALMALAISTSSSAADRRLSTAVEAALPVAREAYEYLHVNPELGKQELKAHEYIVRQLRSLGYRTFAASHSLPTAVIAVLDTGRPGRTIALRAELDARPLPKGVEEPASHSPRSTVSGVMHNCGHDLHAAVLLGVAALLKNDGDRLSGRVVFVFQPAEETPGGADDIVRDGVLRELGVTEIFAEHVAPGMPIGTVGLAPGDNLAGSSYFKLRLDGRSSHAAAPYEGDDVALGAMRVAQELSTLPARSLDISARPAIVSITRFVAASEASNILPATAEIEGTLRAFEDPDSAAPGGKSLRSLLTDRVAAVAHAYGLRPTWIEFRNGSPVTRNDPTLASRIIPRLTAGFDGRIDGGATRSMFSEDFAYYTATIRALYFSLGIEKDGLGAAGLHTPDFTVHPAALRTGIELMTLLAELATSNEPLRDRPPRTH